MPTAISERRTGRPSEVMLDTLRRFVRRGSRASISKLLGKVRPEDVALLMRRLTPAERHEVFTVQVTSSLSSSPPPAPSCWSDCRRRRSRAFSS
jgi:hypothetical protein